MIANAIIYDNRNLYLFDITTFNLNMTKLWRFFTNHLYRDIISKGRRIYENYEH